MHDNEELHVHSEEMRKPMNQLYKKIKTVGENKKM